MTQFEDISQRLLDSSRSISELATLRRIIWLLARSQGGELRIPLELLIADEATAPVGRLTWDQEPAAENGTNGTGDFVFRALDKADP